MREQMGGRVPVAGVTPGEVERFIRTRMTLAPLAFRPDIALYRPTPRSGLTGWLAAHGLADQPPYWAYSWGGGAALALYLRDHPERVAGRSVLDLGAGSGLVAIAAAKAGAAPVLAMESDSLGRIATGLNATANAVSVAIVETADVPQVDIVLAGDVFYDPSVTQTMLPLLARAQAAGMEIIVGDPFRKTLPLDRLDELARYPVPDFGSGETMVEAAVFALRR